MFLKCLKSQYLQRQGRDQNHPDRLFLLSLVPELQQVPEHWRLDLKSRIMRMIGQAKQVAYPQHGNMFQQGHYSDQARTSRYGPTDYGYPPQRPPPSLTQDGAGIGPYTPVNVTVPVTVAPNMYHPNLQNHRTYTPLHQQPVNPLSDAPVPSPNGSNSLSPSDFAC